MKERKLITVIKYSYIITYRGSNTINNVLKVYVGKRRVMILYDANMEESLP